MPEQVGRWQDRMSASRRDERGAGAHPGARGDGAAAVRQSPGGGAIPNFLYSESGSFATCTSLNTSCFCSGGLI